jgi:hypothetical protein
MFANIFRFINLSNETPIIIFGGTEIKDEPICEDNNDHVKKLSYCIDNWVIEDTETS